MSQRCLFLRHRLVLLFSCIITQMSPAFQQGPFVKTGNTTERDCTQNITVQSAGNGSSVSLVIRSIVNFMCRYMDVCGETPLCTLKNQKVIPLLASLEACCSPCSCQVTCYTSGSCCPDIWLQDFLKLQSPFDTIPQLEGYLRMLDETDIAVLESIILNQDDKFDYNISTGKPTSNTKQQVGDMIATCFETKVTLTYTQMVRIVSDVPTYTMVNHCPLLTNVTMDNSCETNMTAINRLETGHIKDIIPLTIIGINTTFVNQYCLHCNGFTEDDAVYWDMVISCLNTDKLPDISLDSLDVVAWKCQTYFRPPANLQGVAKVCTDIDRDHCTNEHSSPVEMFICKTYTNVVTSKNMLRFKNVACYICSGDKQSNGKCFGDQRARFTVNINKEIYNSSTIANDTTNTSFDNRCNQGYVMDKVGICRKVLCPAFHQVIDGVCRPFITRVNNVVFGTTLMMTSTSYCRDVNLEKLRLIQLDALSIAHVYLSSKANASVWIFNEQCQYYFIHITVLSDEKTKMEDTLNGISILAHKLQALHSMTSRLTSRYDFTRAVSRGQIFDWQEDSILTSFISFPLQPEHQTINVYIEETLYCLRIQLELNESTILTKRTYVIKATAAIISSFYFDLKVCLNYIVDGNVESVFHNTGSDNLKKSAFLDSKEFILTVCVVIVILTVVTVRVYKLKCRSSWSVR